MPSSHATANEPEAQRCVGIAAEHVRKLQFEKAVKFCKKAIQLSPGTTAAMQAERLLQGATEAIESGRAPRVTESGPSTSSSSTSTTSSSSATGTNHARGSPPASAAAPPQAPNRAPAAVTRAIEWACDWLGGCGITEEYRFSVLCVYCAIVVVVAYKALFVWGDEVPGTARRGGTTYRGGASRRHGAAAHRGGDYGLTFWGGFLPGDVAYTSPSFSLYMPFVTMFVVAKVMQWANNANANRRR